MLKNKLRQILKKWLVLYVVSLILVSIIIFSVFRDSSYPTGQVALVIVIPIFLIILGVKLTQYFSSSEKKRPQRAPEEVDETQRPPHWFLIVSIIFMLLLCGSFIVSIVMFISSGIYSLIDLKWAESVTFHSIAIPLIIVAGISFACFCIMMFLYISSPYWGRIIRIAKRRFRIWSGMTKEISINGYKIPLHR